ncbi:glycosyltransferase family 4 protein [Alkanindiges illinoisensis]|uniref:glycosyltransferase family 4 protein n=1 Tax=Alkanindiges illinoisensis TaxID=197183 RepID=UPI00054FAF2E|nr:glycosyltransferase family 4 protein [Alkanindiges illinoisensis]
MQKNSDLKRVLIITRNLPPLIGGMERLNWHMADELSKYYCVKVIAPTGSANLKPKHLDMIEVPLVPLWLFLILSLWEAIKITLQWKPDIILAGSGLTALAAKLSSIFYTKSKSVAYLHGLDITADHRLYRLIWLPILRQLDHVITNSSPTSQLVSNLGIPDTRVSIIFPGVNLPRTIQTQAQIEQFLHKYQLQNKHILLSVGRLTTRKGIHEFIQYALPDIVKAMPNIVLVIIGESPKNALLAETQSKESIEATVSQLGLQEHVKFLGKIDDQSLSYAYESSHVHVFPVRHIPNDPEGFGMVAIEAAAHGLPTVAFATGGVVDAISDGKSGYLVRSEDYLLLTQAVIKALALNNFWKKSCQTFAKNFTWENFGNDIKTKLNNILN